MGKCLCMLCWSENKLLNTDQLRSKPETRVSYELSVEYRNGISRRLLTICTIIYAWYYKWIQKCTSSVIKLFRYIYIFLSEFPRNDQLFRLIKARKILCNILFQTTPKINGERKTTLWYKCHTMICLGFIREIQNVINVERKSTLENKKLCNCLIV